MSPFSYRYTGRLGLDAPLTDGRDTMLCPAVGPPIDPAVFDQQVDWELFCAQPVMNAMNLY